MALFSRKQKTELIGRAIITPPKTSQSPAALVLAAGRGQRFDATGKISKMLVEIDGLPTILHTLSTIQSVLAPVVVVTRPDGHGQTIAGLVERFGCTSISCPDAGSGMGHSLAWGIGHLLARSSPPSILIALGDMPFVKAKTIQALRAHCRTPADIAVPRYLGKQGNPVLFGSDHFEALGRLNGDRGARQLLDNQSVIWVDVDDPGVLQDIDTPTDLPKPKKISSTKPIIK